MAAWLLLTLGFCGCTRETQVKTEEQATLHEDVSAHSTQAAAATASSSEVRTRAATDVKTTVDHREFGVLLEDQDGGVTLARVGAAPLALARGAKVVGTVALDETTTAREEHRGGVTDTKATASTATETGAEDVGLKMDAAFEAKGEKDTATHWGLPWWLWLAGAAAVVIAGGLAWKLKPPWLTAAIAVVKKL